MQIAELNWLLLIVFTVVYTLTFTPVNLLMKWQSEMMMLGYYCSIAARVAFVVVFVAIGAREEILVGVAIGLLLEMFSMFRIVRNVQACEVLA